MRRILFILTILAAISCYQPGQTRSTSQTSSFVYLIECNGAIQKFDLATKKEIAKWQPVDIAGLSDVVPLPIRDGCALNSVQFDPEGGKLAAVAPLSPTVTGYETQRYVLLLIEVPAMKVAAHVELPGSATTPTVALRDSHEFVVGYETPRADQPNEVWIVRYNASTLDVIGQRERSTPPPAVESPRSLPSEIPLSDKFTHPVFADR